jgi:hypothetical protein
MDSEQLFLLLIAFVGLLMLAVLVYHIVFKLKQRAWILRLADEYNTESEFIDWQHETMMQVVIANSSLCDDGYAISIDPVRIYKMAKDIRERARTDKGIWSHADESRAVDATIGWCARWLGMVIPGPSITPAAYQAAHVELANIKAGGNITVTNGGTVGIKK